MKKGWWRHGRDHSECDITVERGEIATEGESHACIREGIAKGEDKIRSSTGVWAKEAETTIGEGDLTDKKRCCCEWCGGWKEGLGEGNDDVFDAHGERAILLNPRW